MKRKSLTYKIEDVIMKFITVVTAITYFLIFCFYLFIIISIAITLGFWLINEINVSSFSINFETFFTIGFLGGILTLGIIIMIPFLFFKTANFPTKKIKYYREIPSDLPPAVMQYFTSLGRSVNILPVTILDLINRGYLLADISSKKNIMNLNFNNRISLGNKDLTELRLYEQEIINHIFNKITNDNTITLWEIRVYLQSRINNSKVSEFRRRLYNLVYQEVIDRNLLVFLIPPIWKNYKAVSVVILIILLKYMVEIETFFTFLSWGAIPFFIGMIILSFYIIYGIGRPTIKSYEEFQKWRGLKAYLKAASNMRNREIKQIVHWDDYLISATAFGSANLISRDLKAFCLRFNLSKIFFSRFYDFALWHQIYRKENR